MTDTTAKIRAKGLDATGVTEEIADQMYSTLGRYTMAIVELKHEAHSINAEGKRIVECVITQVEPSTSTELDDHLRNLTRTMHQNRALHATDAQLQIESMDDLEPKVEDVLLAGQHLIAVTDDELPEPDEQDDPEPDDEPDQGDAEDTTDQDADEPTPLPNPFAITR